MVSKDQAIGGLIFLVCVVVIVGYVIALFGTGYVAPLFDIKDIRYAQFWLIAIPVFIAFIAILGIGAWIGWTMATTPPPKPLEEIEAEEKKEEEKAAEEEEEKAGEKEKKK